MGKFDDEVKEKIGEPAFNSILDAVEEDIITGEKMEDFARKLHRKVAGSHTKRRRLPGMNDGAEMRHILSDWYEFGGLVEMATEDAQKRLLEIFSSPEISLNPLVVELKKIFYRNTKR